jgi:hypothetical protein
MLLGCLSGIDIIYSGCLLFQMFTKSKYEKKDLDIVKCVGHPL